MLESMKKADKKIIIMLGFLLVVIIIFILLIVIISSLGGGKLSYSKIENKMVSGAKAYYKDNQANLPQNVGETAEIDSATLSSNGYIKDLSEYVKDDTATCSGKVIVTKLEDDYDYVANLDCGDKYKTTFLYEKLIGTKVENGDGLYAMEDFLQPVTTLGFDADGNDLSDNPLLSGYVYRGQDVDNYIKIDDITYRILKIDGNNDFTLVTTSAKHRGVYDNRYNSETEHSDGINDYPVSIAHSEIKEIYETNLISDKKSTLYKKRVTKDVCVGKRNDEDSAKNGQIECSEVMADQYFSLIPMYDIMNASLSTSCTTTASPECGNYNYLVEKEGFWSMTGNKDSTSKVYNILNKKPVAYKANTSGLYKYVVYVSNRLVYSKGSGTEDDPYIVK